MDNKLALSGALVRKTGEGYYNGTWTDGDIFLAVHII